MTSSKDKLPQVWPAEPNALLAKMGDVSPVALLEWFKMHLERGSLPDQKLYDMIEDDELPASVKINAIRVLNESRQRAMDLLIAKGMNNPVMEIMQAMFKKAAEDGIDLEPYTEWLKLGKPGSTRPIESTAAADQQEPTSTT